MRDLEAAQHEAAHVVVGVAVGLHLLRASVLPPPAENWTAPGHCWFRGDPKRHVAEATMFAAGVAWERAVGNSDPTDAYHDLAGCVDLVGPDNAETCIRLARATLFELARVHTRVTRALLERDLTVRDISKIVRGER